MADLRHILILPKGTDRSGFLKKYGSKLEDLGIVAYPWSARIDTEPVEYNFKVWVNLLHVPIQAWNMSHLVPLVAPEGLLLDHTPLEKVTSLESMRVVLAVKSLSDVPYAFGLNVRGLVKPVQVQLLSWAHEPTIIRPPIDTTPSQLYFDSLQQRLNSLARKLPENVSDSKAITVDYYVAYEVWAQMPDSEERERLEASLKGSPLWAVLKKKEQLAKEKYCSSLGWAQPPTSSAVEGGASGSSSLDLIPSSQPVDLQLGNKVVSQLVAATNASQSALEQQGQKLDLQLGNKVVSQLVAATNAGHVALEQQGQKLGVVRKLFIADPEAGGSAFVPSRETPSKTPKLKILLKKPSFTQLQSTLPTSDAEDLTQQEGNNILDIVDQPTQDMQGTDLGRTITGKAGDSSASGKSLNPPSSDFLPLLGCQAQVSSNSLAPSASVPLKVSKPKKKKGFTLLNQEVRRSARLQKFSNFTDNLVLGSKKSRRKAASGKTPPASAKKQIEDALQAVGLQRCSDLDAMTDNPLIQEEDDGLRQFCGLLEQARVDSDLALPLHDAQDPHNDSDEGLNFSFSGMDDIQLEGTDNEEVSMGV